MSKLSREAKEAIVRKTLSRSGKTVREIAKENDVGYSTLNRWLQNFREGEPLPQRKPAKPKPPNKQNENLPLKHVLATANLDEQTVGAYCRENGIYQFQLESKR